MVKLSPSSPSSRRSFLSRLWLALGLVAFFQMVAGVFLFLFSGRKEEGKQESQPVEIGLVDDFSPGSVTFIGKGNFYLSRLEDGGFLAISRKCTHLGCAVPWIAERKQFECPCHASIFDQTGNVIKAPAPRALDLYPITLERERVIVDVGKSVRRSGFEADQVVYVQGRS